MTLYFSEKNFEKEFIEYLRKNYPRGIKSSNRLEIERADNIDYRFFLEYFDCAVARQHNLYTAAINLPMDLNDRIPFWFVRSDGEIWVDPQSGLRGKNIRGEEVFTLKFNLYVDEEKIHKIDETKNTPAEEALIEEFDEIRHSLIEGNEEAIDIFRAFYENKGYKTPKSRTANYLASILTVPH